MTFTPATLAAVLAPIANDPASETRKRTTRAVIAAFDRLDLIFSRDNYLETLEQLGTGVLLVAHAQDGRAVYVLPLPRYRKRTPDGRHA
jgi:hypothetical protein